MSLESDVQSARADLAAVFRWATRLGFHEGICNHFSLMVPGRDDLFLINAHGTHWSQITASSLMLLNSEGDIVEGEGRVEETALYIHWRVHRALPHARCVLHTHMPYATALTSLEDQRLHMINQNCVRFHDRIVYDDAYNGLALDNDEGDRIAAALGERCQHLADLGVELEILDERQMKALGMGALQINSGLNSLMGLPVGDASQVGIIVVTTVLFLASAVTGVTKGIKWLSNVNLTLAALLTLAVFTMGPTVAIIDTFTSTLGSYVSEFVRMSLRMTPFRDSGWVSGWTIFYWAWWVSWSPFVGLFIARVSRGRSIREFILGTVLAPTLAAFVWFSVFGGTALNQEIMQGLPMAEAVGADVSTAMFAMFDALPLSGLLSGVATVLVLLFFVTSGDSATLVLGMMSTGGQANPGARVKIVWGLLVSGIAISLLLAGGVKAVQTATIVFALPFTLVIVLMAVALWRGVRDDWDDEQRRDKALRRRMKSLVEQPQPPAA